MTDVTSRIADARNVLLCAPSMSGRERGLCADLLLPEDPATASVLWVAYRGDPAGCTDRWFDAVETPPRDAAVIASGDVAGETPAGVEVDALSSPSDLTGLGIVIGERLSSWDGDLRLCFDSITAMLQYVDAETAYEFLHAITGQLYAADARAHFHLDPSAHDEQTVASITSLFDAVVHLGDGEPEVRTRQLPK